MNTSANNYKNLSCSIDSSTLTSLFKAGFKPVPLSESHKPVLDWSPIYDNPLFWEPDTLNDPTECSKFKNVASALGKSHLKDLDNKELFIQVLDCDSDYVYSILTKPIGKLNLSSALQLKIHNFLIQGVGIPEIEIANSTLIDVFNKSTFVTKTKKPCGFHVWWLSHNQNKSISTKDCKKDHEFEIKTDKKNGLCTLPPSTHRDDAIFRYSAVGRTDEIIINDTLYGLFIELFRDGLIKKDEKERIAYEGSNEKNNSLISPIVFYSLSPEIIDASASILIPFYIEHYGNNFSLCFSGYAHHCRISEDSAGKIISEICKRKADKDVKERLTTLHCTYTKARDGRHITGGPILADFMSKVKGVIKT